MHELLKAISIAAAAGGQSKTNKTLAKHLNKVNPCGDRPQTELRVKQFGGFSPHTRFDIASWLVLFSLRSELLWSDPPFVSRASEALPGSWHSDIYEHIWWGGRETQPSHCGLGTLVWVQLDPLGPVKPSSFKVLS